MYILLLSFKCVTHCDNIFCMYFMDWCKWCFFLLLYSLGCGIGYGYLHRIPKRQFPSSKSSAVPSAPAPASVDGFAEVGSVMLISFWSVELRTVDSCTVLVVTGTLFCIFIENHLILDLILIKQYFGITNNWYFAQTIHWDTVNHQFFFLRFLIDCFTAKQSFIYTVLLQSSHLSTNAQSWKLILVNQ